MKNQILILLVILFAGCSGSSKEKLIQEFEETTSPNTKIDLSFKVKDISLIGKITAKDSIDYYVSEFKRRFNDSPETAEDILRMAKKELKGGEHILDSIKNEMAELKSNGKEYKYLQEVIDRFGPSIKFGRNAHDCLDKYISKPNDIIGNKWKCTYTIVNPILNNAKQEITNVYVFNEDNSILILKMLE